MAPDLSTVNHPPHRANTPPLPSFSKVFPHFHENVASLSNDVDPFTVNATTGFLPTKDPIKDLPHAFKPLQKIVDEMPAVKQDGSPGLLAAYELGPLIDSNTALPDLTDEIDNLKVPETQKPDLHLVTALFRDYSFLASAYLLEPCWQTYNKNRASSNVKNGQKKPSDKPSVCPHSVTNEYGFGRPVLPAAIARPLVKLAQILDIPPFMSYAASYALYNYYLVDPSIGSHQYDNIRLIRSFERGQDPKSSEAGFILTHIHMVALTGPLIASAVSALESIDSLTNNTFKSSPTDDTTTTKVETVTTLKSSLHTLLTTMTQIEANMERMWANSHPADYPIYRTFIFGITSQPLFPNGVIYRGCFDDKPQAYRGESGANDSIIPLLDNLCQIPMPKNPLTSILREFRGYRPESQRALLSWTESKATELETRAFFASGGGDRLAGSSGGSAAAGLDVDMDTDSDSNSDGDAGTGTTTIDPELTVLYLRILNHIRSFRWRHWQFAREYIIKKSAYPVATGGSPIVTWLPNQLSAVLDLMEGTYRDSGLMALVSEGEFDGGGMENGVGGKSAGLSVEDAKIVKGIMEVVVEQRGKLEREVKKYCEERGV